MPTNLTQINVPMLAPDVVARLLPQGLTVTTSAVCTLAVAVSAGKTLTLTATDNYNLTIPATGTAALLAVANVFTTVQTVQVATTTSKGLILKTTDNNTTNNLLEIQNSAGTAIDFIRADGTLDLGYTNIPTTSNSMVDIQKRDGATSGTSRGVRIQLTPYTGSNSSALYYGLAVTVTPAGGDPNFTGALYGASYAVSHGRTGTVTQATGQTNTILNSAAGTITTAQGTQIYIINSGAGTIGTGYGIDIQGQQTNAAGTLETFYAFYIRDMYKPSGGTITNQYGLYIQDQTKGGTYNSAITTNAGLIVFNEGGDSASDVRMEGDTDANLFVTDASVDAAAIGVAAGSLVGKFHIDQSSSTGAKPVLTLDQADVSEEFVRFIGTSANATLTQSLVEAADVSTFTPVGYAKIYVVDTGDQITDQAYFVQFGTLA